MSFKEALQDWWDSRDVRKIRKRRRLKAMQYLKNLDKKEKDNDLENVDTDSNFDEEKVSKVITLKKQFLMKGHFFVSSFKKGYKWGIYISIFFLILVSFLLVILLSSDLFAVSTFEYKYTESAFINDTVLNEQINSFIGINIFLLNEEEIENKLTDFFQTVELVKVDKLYPKTLLISINEFKPAIILRKGQLEDTEFLVNQAGQIVANRAYSGINAEYVTVLTTETDMDLKIGDIVMNKSQVDFFYKAESLFEDKVGIPVVSIWWLKREQEVHMWTQKYFKVMMTLNRDVESQIEDMIVSLQEADIRKRNFEYIDLRVKGKVFVKTR